MYEQVAYEQRQRHLNATHLGKWNMDESTTTRYNAKGATEEGGVEGVYGRDGLDGFETQEHSDINSYFRAGLAKQDMRLSQLHDRFSQKSESETRTPAAVFRGFRRAKEPVNDEFNGDDCSIDFMSNSLVPEIGQFGTNSLANQYEPLGNSSYELISNNSRLKEPLPSSMAPRYSCLSYQGFNPDFEYQQPDTLPAMMSKFDYLSHNTIVDCPKNTHMTYSLSTKLAPHSDQPSFRTIRSLESDDLTQTFMSEAQQPPGGECLAKSGPEPPARNPARENMHMLVYASKRGSEVSDSTTKASQTTGSLGVSSRYSTLLNTTRTNSLKNEDLTQGGCELNPGIDINSDNCLGTVAVLSPDKEQFQPIHCAKIVEEQKDNAQFNFFLKSLDNALNVVDHFALISPDTAPIEPLLHQQEPASASTTTASAAHSTPFVAKVPVVKLSRKFGGRKLATSAKSLDSKSAATFQAPAKSSARAKSAKIVHTTSDYEKECAEDPHPANRLQVKSAPPIAYRDSSRPISTMGFKYDDAPGQRLPTTDCSLIKPVNQAPESNLDKETQKIQPSLSPEPNTLQLQRYSNQRRQLKIQTKLSFSNKARDGDDSKDATSPIRSLTTSLKRGLNVARELAHSKSYRIRHPRLVKSTAVPAETRGKPENV